ncbi:MAG: SDR family oxidoreductase [Gammaproteobacteria bacterium]|nr:SDR family oxidoreductase [Gammaproteobacteria bacterium]
MSKPRALITGTSTGIGLATAVHLGNNGFEVFASMRNLAKSSELADAVAKDNLGVRIVELDVTRPDTICAVVDDILRDGPLDVLVNNAGVGGATPLELVPESEHRAIFEANYFGTIGMIQAVLPHMRERKSGTIVNVTSMEGRIAIPNQIPYSASKWALECASEALAHEVYRFGVRVCIIEPGVIMTKIFENSAPATRYASDSPYKQIMRRNGKMFSAGFRIGEPPETVAKVILEAITTDDPKLRYLVGEDAKSFVAGRDKISDEAWVEMGGDLSDDEYNERYRSYFGITLE